MLGCFITEMASLRKLMGLMCLSCFLQICTGSNQDPQQVDGLVGGNVTLPLEYNYVGEELFWSYNDTDTGRIVYIALIRTNGKPTEYYPLKYKLGSTGSLKIIRLQKEDSRVYQADVPKGKKFKKNYSLSVYTEPKPRVEICPDTCVLLCSVENDSNVTLSWLKGDGTILNKTSSVNETTLVLSHDMPPDNVTYTCVASNPASNRTANVTCHSNRWTEPEPSIQWSSYHNDASEKDNDTSDYDDDDDNDIGDMVVKEKSSLIQNGQNTDS
ncbi:UNVERIFIED_CONTAM: hypothetical protein FKN15_053376 [Acipenser sinensis]